MNSLYCALWWHGLWWQCVILGCIVSETHICAWVEALLQNDWWALYDKVVVSTWAFLCCWCSGLIDCLQNDWLCCTRDCYEYLDVLSSLVSRFGQLPAEWPRCGASSHAHHCRRLGRHRCWVSRWVPVRRSPPRTHGRREAVGQRQDLEHFYSQWSKFFVILTGMKYVSLLNGQCETGEPATQPAKWTSACAVPSSRVCVA